MKRPRAVEAAEAMAHRKVIPMSTQTVTEDKGFAAYLKTADAAIAEPWQLDMLREMAFPAAQPPEIYKQLREALATAIVMPADPAVQS